ncbi:ferritin-like domain-containing protein [Ktedonosporobacter rubrisoli]|uniref:Ferritin-like domain-containing protein n=1 Tax=Ktedonosporobacter rubrisoli TaxID=2509675 RepID=A0A4P6JR11_KTERU|nr:ferritin-like domain-containing protein [Ktedonosporobacter rubrisoli]QBD77216.1 ferritin-like domain-containing protein [Ktedonosporobacter rubrisoli]
MMKGRTKKDSATANLLASFASARSRRAVLKGAIAGAAGVTAGAAGFALTPLSSMPAYAKAVNFHATAGNVQTTDTAATILTVARTAEQLAVTFYSNGVANADKLGLKGNDLENIKAALVEEQIHQQFFAANGGSSLAETFSFPKGAQTFTDLKTFIDTQQQLEGVFDSAFLAAIFEFAQMGRPDLAQLSGQVATVEAEHRALGRQIGGLSPADNWAFSPVLLATVGDAPALVQKAGFLSPSSGNSYTYQEVSIENAGIEQRKPFTASSSVVGNG